LLLHCHGFAPLPLPQWGEEENGKKKGKTPGLG